MRRAISIASHIAFVLFAAATAIYGVIRFIDEIRRPGKTAWDIVALVLFLLYAAAVLRVDFYMFLNAGSLAYGIGRSKKSRVVLSIIVFVSGVVFVIPPVVAIICRMFTGTDPAFGRWVHFAVLGDFVIYVFVRWIRFLTSVSEEGKKE